MPTRWMKERKKETHEDLSFRSTAVMDACCPTAEENREEEVEGAAQGDNNQVVDDIRPVGVLEVLYKEKLEGETSKLVLGRWMIGSRRKVVNAELKTTGVVKNQM